MRLLSLICLAFVVSNLTSVSAKVPQKPLFHQFNRLVSKSPFTIRESIATQAPVSPLERDWSLGSISPSGEGYSVTLINKKNRKDRIRFIPGFSAGDYQLHEVNQNAQNSKMSKVQVSKGGGQKSWITYDEKVVALRAAKPAKPTNKGKKTQSGSRGRPPVATKKSTTKPTPKVRHVPRRK